MSLRKGLARFLVVIAPIVLVSVNATECRAQSQDENAIATAPVYKTISIKANKSSIHANGIKLSPDELTATNVTPQLLIGEAYEVRDDQIVGAPIWLNSKRYDIEAKADNPAAGDGGEHMLEKGVLSDGFKLAFHRETRLIPVYELATAGDGPKLRESVPEESPLRVIQVEKGRIVGKEVPVATLARILSEELGRPVLDNTHLSSHYDVTLQWPTAPESSDPAILTAVQEQLGLRLIPQLMPKEFLVIDHVEMPMSR